MNKKINIKEFNFNEIIYSEEEIKEIHFLVQEIYLPYYQPIFFESNFLKREINFLACRQEN